MWAAHCTLKALPPAQSWPRWPASTDTSPYSVFAALDKMQRRKSPATVDWLVAALNKTRATGDSFPFTLRLLLWQLVAHSQKQAHRHCFAKVVVDTGLVADVNAEIRDQSFPFPYTLLYVTIYAQLADPTLAQLLVRSAGASPVEPLVNGEKVVHHALYWQVRMMMSLCCIVFIGAAFAD